MNRVANVLSDPESLDRLGYRSRIYPDGNRLRDIWNVSDEVLEELMAHCPGFTPGYCFGMTTTPEAKHVPEPIHQDHERLDCTHVFLVYLTPAKLEVFNADRTVSKVLQFQANEGVLIQADTWHRGVDTERDGRELIVLPLKGETDVRDSTVLQ